MVVTWCKCHSATGWALHCVLRCMCLRGQILVGIFWPSIMALRSQYLPNNVRATILNLFRIPLNLFVCLVLYNVRALPPPAELPA